MMRQPYNKRDLLPMVKLDAPLALYEKIKQSIIRDIDSGKLKPDDKVPSETRLATAFNASRMTANRALKELTEEKRIVRIQGVGTFVARPKTEAALLEIKSIAKEIESLGGVHTCEVLTLEQIPGSAQVSDRLGLPRGVPVFHSILLHKHSGIPVQYSERFINPKVAPDYLAQDFSTLTPSEYLLSHAPVQQAEHEIEAIQVDEKIAALLEIDVADPCLCLTRRTWSFDQVATFSRMISPGSRYTLKGRFQRG